MNRIIFVDGIKSGESVDAYSLTGQRVSGQISSGERLEIYLPPGIYIIRSGTASQKVYNY